MLAAVAELVAFGTFGFFVLIFAAAVIIAIAVEYDRGTGATVTLVGTVLAVHFLSGVNIFSFVGSHLLWFLGGAVLYILAGGAWSLAKLGFVAARIDSRYLRLREAFCSRNNIENGTKIGDDAKLRERWAEVLERENIDINKTDGRPTFDHRKRWRTVYMWIGHWPFSMFGTVFNDVVRQAIDLVYARLDKTYERIERGVLGKHAGDLETSLQRKDAAAAAAAAGGGSSDFDGGLGQNRGNYRRRT